MSKLEPLFARQEQAVVYFFCRYWDQIAAFHDKWVYDIQVHFPDASMEDQRTGDLEAIEFEYALSSFDHHYKSADRKKLKEFKSLYIVYWDEDTDKEELREDIKEKGVAARVEFVCLGQHFSPGIEREADRLGAYWEFRPTKCFSEVYPFKEIEAVTKALVKDSIIQPLKVNDDLYRVAGFNKSNADFIECDHWKRIHFYTTTHFHDDCVPSQLFVKPTGSGCFSGCFEVRHAFRILKVKDERLTDYFRKFYFYPYEEYEPEDLLRHTCLVYSGFTELDVEQGVEIYDYLSDKGYALRQASELVEDSRHRRRIDKIVASGIKRP